MGLKRWRPLDGGERGLMIVRTKFKDFKEVDKVEVSVNSKKIYILFEDGNMTSTAWENVIQILSKEATHGTT